eukprot:scpid90752/ scgid25493/ 
MGLPLTVDAQLFYQCTPVVTRQGPLQPLAQALAARFAPPQPASLHIAEFKVLRQGNQASLSYCEAVRHAAVLAYPHMPGQDRDTLAKDQFMAGLDSRAVRIRVRELAPDTLDAALQSALHQQAILHAETLESPGNPPPVCGVNSSHPELDDVTTEIQTITSRLDTFEQ